MNPGGRQAAPRRRAFTLIELLVVLVIIGILAALVYSTISVINRKVKIAATRTQLQRIAAAIDAYKTRLGFYPPDNPNNPAINPLYFELLGTTNNGNSGPTNWITLDHSAQISSVDPAVNISTVFGVQGFLNTSPGTRSEDQAVAAIAFLDNLTPNQIGSLPTNSQIKVLVCTIEWPAGTTSAPIPNTQLNPWCYNSSHPTNNTGSYDLWVDLVIGGKTYRVSNWSQ